MMDRDQKLLWEAYNTNPQISEDHLVAGEEIVNILREMEDDVEIQQLDEWMQLAALLTRLGPALSRIAPNLGSKVSGAGASIAPKAAAGATPPVIGGGGSASGAAATGGAAGMAASGGDDDDSDSSDDGDGSNQPGAYSQMPNKLPGIEA